jgi:hypothetical protein
MNERQKKIMVPYEEPTDTCPDCSNIPCNCGIPAGYKPDIRFAANFAPHIKVVEVSSLIEVMQQRDELLRYNEAFRQETLICADCDAIRKEEYDQAIEQRDRLAEALRKIQRVGLVAVDAFDELDRIDEIVDEALAAVKGESDES